jgi:hypothetical protein
LPAALTGGQVVNGCWRGSVALSVGVELWWPSLLLLLLLHVWGQCTL